jgi:hypothetical protein
MTSVYRVDTRHRPQLLFAMMKFFAADGSRIAFEGNLIDTGLFKMDGASHEETGTLKRATTAPPLDFVVLPLDAARVTDIEKAIDSKVAFNGYKGIVHVQIEAQGEIAFAAFDNFGRDSVIVTSRVSTSVLDDLVTARILKGYAPATK